ncbi:MAG: hypothetical protein V4630_03545 [Pseudomonadota bacterium]
MAQGFNRTEMLPPLPPPVTERGAIKWLRENLFSTPFNVVLTLFGVAVIYLLLQSALPWWLNSVWNAESLSQCREIVAASAGPDATGACWAMIRERWHQFLFGFYPPAEYWRPILAFGLLFAALAPVRRETTHLPIRKNDGISRKTSNVRLSTASTVPPQ